MATDCHATTIRCASLSATLNREQSMSICCGSANKVGVPHTHVSPITSSDIISKRQFVYATDTWRKTRNLRTLHFLEAKYFSVKLLLWYQIIPQQNRVKDIYPTRGLQHIWIAQTGARWRSVKALCYKPAGRGFDSRWCHWNFSVT
jgi:hypothetical protein